MASTINISFNSGSGGSTGSLSEQGFLDFLDQAGSGPLLDVEELKDISNQKGFDFLQYAEDHNLIDTGHGNELVQGQDLFRSLAQEFGHHGRLASDFFQHPEGEAAQYKAGEGDRYVTNHKTFNQIASMDGSNARIDRADLESLRKSISPDDTMSIAEVRALGNALNIDNLEGFARDQGLFQSRGSGHSDVLSGDALIDKLMNGQDSFDKSQWDNRLNDLNCGCCNDHPDHHGADNPGDRGDFSSADTHPSGLNLDFGFGPQVTINPGHDGQDTQVSIGGAGRHNGINITLPSDMSANFQIDRSHSFTLSAGNDNNTQHSGRSNPQVTFNLTDLFDSNWFNRRHDFQSGGEHSHM